MEKINLILIFLIILISGCAVDEVPKEISQDPTDVVQVSAQELTEDISFMKEDFEEFLEEAEEENIEVSEDLINKFNSLLKQAENDFEKGNIVEASRLVKQAETLLEDAFVEGDFDNIDPQEEQMRAYWQSVWNPNIKAAFGEKQCDTSKKPFEFNLEPYHSGSPPETACRFRANP